MKAKLIILSTTLLLMSCFTPKKTQINKSNDFTTNQRSLINKADNKTPMEILLITNKEDSMILRTKSKDINLKTKIFKNSPTDY